MEEIPPQPHISPSVIPHFIHHSLACAVFHPSFPSTFSPSLSLYPSPISLPLFIPPLHSLSSLVSLTSSGRALYKHARDSASSLLFPNCPPPSETAALIAFSHSIVKGKKKKRRGRKGRKKKNKESPCDAARFVGRWWESELPVERGTLRHVDETQ